MRKNALGFTVIELIFVVLILAILTSLAAPSFQQLAASTRVKGAVMDIQLSLLRARSEAIKQSSPITVSAASGGWINGWSTSGGVDQHGAIASTAIVIAGASSITFQPNGLPTNPNFAVSVTSPSTPTARCVKVLLSGEPNVKEAACL